jgi:hypothetical protein
MPGTFVNCPPFNNVAPIHPMRPYRQMPYDVGTDLILGTDVHHCVRNGPETPTSAADPTFGTRSDWALSIGAGVSRCANGQTRLSSDRRRVITKDADADFVADVDSLLPFSFTDPKSARHDVVSSIPGVPIDRGFLRELSTSVERDEIVR